MRQKAPSRSRGNVVEICAGYNELCCRCKNWSGFVVDSPAGEQDGGLPLIRASREIDFDEDSTMSKEVLVDVCSHLGRNSPKRTSIHVCGLMHAVRSVRSRLRG